MRSNWLAFRNAVLFPVLLCTHTENDAIDHIRLVTVVVGLWILPCVFDCFCQERVLISETLEHPNMLLHLVEAVDIVFLESHRIFPCVAHHKHDKTITGQMVTRLSVSLFIEIARLSKIGLSEFFTHT